MRFFIKRKNKFIKQAAFGSALIMVSAFAVFNSAFKVSAAPISETDSVAKDTTLTARSVFEKIHLSALEILPPSTRLDMLDYWDVDSVYKASNAMEGLSWLEAVSPDFLKVRVTPVSVFEIKILPLKKGKLVMTISTVGDDVQSQDSQIRFFDENLKEVPSGKYFETPHLKEFFSLPKGSVTTMKEIESMIPFPTIAYSANASNNNLEARLTVEKYINEDDWNIIRIFLKQPLVIEWKKEKYK